MRIEIEKKPLISCVNRSKLYWVSIKEYFIGLAYGR